MRSPVAPARLVAAAALAGAVGLGLAPAAAGASAESAGTVSFSGGCGMLGTGLGGSSTPDAAQMSLPAGTEVSFANRLGQPATLSLDGQAISEVAPGSTADVIFLEGPVTATMQISCLLGNPAGAVTIEVVPAPQPGAQPSPSTSPSAPAGRTTTGRTTGPDSPSGTSTSVAPPGSGSGSNGSGWSGWSDQTGPDTGTPPPAQRPGSEPSTEDERSAESELGARWGDLADGGGHPSDRATVGGQSAEQEPLAEQLSPAAGSVPGEGPIGLLALLATVCVVGVSAGAIRVMVARRTRPA